MTDPTVPHVINLDEYRAPRVHRAMTPGTGDGVVVDFDRFRAARRHFFPYDNPPAAAALAA